MLTAITIPMAFLDTQKVDNVLYFVRYGDDSEEINEIVAKCEKDGKCDMYSIKARSEDIGKSILPYKKYTFLGALSDIRDYLWKQNFIKYIEEHPDERFFQALRNYCASQISERMKFIGYSEDGQKYYDSFYLELRKRGEK